jgi:hypothetical protein
MKLNTFEHCVILLLGFVITSLAVNSLAQEQGADFYARNGMSAITPSWDSIRQQISPHDKKIADQVRVYVHPTEGVNARAAIEAGSRTIYITAGMLEIIDWLATAEAVNTITGEKTCQTSYVKYLGDGIAENTDRHHGNLPLSVLTSPYQFYSAHRSMCSAIKPELVNSNQRATLTRTLVMNLSIKYLLGHELGHQVYDYPFADVSWCEQQKKESRADAYSFTLLSQSGESPLVAMPVLLIFASVEGFTTDDRYNTHPAALKRALAMIDATRAQLAEDSELLASIRKTGRLAEFNAYLDQFEANVKQQMAGQKTGCPN